MLNLLKKLLYLLFSVSVSVVLSISLAGIYLSLQAKDLQPSQQVNIPDPQIAQVLQTMKIPTPTVFPTLAPTPTITSSSLIITSPTPPHLSKNNYTIAVYGDSMVDTMGETLPYLQSALKKLYPTISFTLYNYGIGAENIEQGLERFDNYFSYKTRNFPQVSSVHPDVLVLGTFGYNPFSPNDTGKYNSLFSQLVRKAKNVTSNTYVLIEIAPLDTNFAKGPQGITDWTDDFRHQHALEIIDLLYAAKSVASLQNIPIIDVFDISKSTGNFGSYTYTNSNDGTHPSIFGHTVTASLIAKTILLR